VLNTLGLDGRRGRRCAPCDGTNVSGISTWSPSVQPGEATGRVGCPDASLDSAGGPGGCTCGEAIWPARSSRIPRDELKSGGAVLRTCLGPPRIKWESDAPTKRRQSTRPGRGCTVRNATRTIDDEAWSQTRRRLPAATPGGSPSDQHRADCPPRVSYLNQFGGHCNSTITAQNRRAVMSVSLTRLKVARRFEPLGKPVRATRRQVGTLPSPETGGVGSVQRRVPGDHGSPKLH
jgi:hypothetical protein